ncbi:MAG: T9SS type A sorting domain-containing protein [Ferruginibacter sp.]|nr:T9SS type A sorting domain-containing protein [Chitinophagaceae bacterium]
MKMKLYTAIFLIASISSYSQSGWKVTNAPVFGNRVDDIFMVNTLIGYAVSGDGKIVKTTDGGENWVILVQNSGIYCRSVEFFDAQRGFVGGFPFGSSNPTNVLRKTTDGGATWTDLTSMLHPNARKGGICGLAVADKNTIYGGGNWFDDAPYIIKSVDAGDTWGFIDMGNYATSIIDMHFLNKDTGFVTGKGPGPIESAIILYTTNGGLSWTKKFENGIPSEYCWKIQRLTSRIYYASIEDLLNYPPKILKSVDGGMTWAIHVVDQVPYNIEGVGFIDPLHGWTGGGPVKSFETKDGGKTWDSVAICPFMNRVFKVNDTMMLASGRQIWKYNGAGIYPAIPDQRYAWMNCYPNPVKDILTMEVSLAVPTRVSLLLMDGTGKQLKTIENADRPKGSYQFYLNTSHLPQGIYYIVLKTHEDKRVVKILVSR